MRHTWTMFFLFLLTGCLTPMSDEEIAALSQCPSGLKLERVRKNLLLAGFVVKEQGKSDITTDYHDETLFSDGKLARRITVTTDDNGQLHFKMWDKRVYYESAGRIGIGSAFAASPHTTMGSGFSIGIGPMCEHSFEETRVYYQQRRAQYEEEQRMVCHEGDKK